MLLAAGTVLWPAGASAAPRDLLPDLRMAPPNEWRLSFEGGRRLLRFSAVIVNVGDGPIIVHGRRACASVTACPTMDLVQRIKRSDGSTRRVQSDAIGRWGGDGHAHFHVQKFERYDMIPLDPAAGIDQVRGSKVGFCFLDTDPWNRSLPGAPQGRVFEISGCRSRRDAMTMRVGISVGWADRYGWYLPRQYVDTTGLEYGSYLICNTADANEDWLEVSETNNQSWAKIDLRRGAQGDRVQLLDHGRGACQKQLPPPPEQTGTWFLDWPEARPMYFDASARIVCTIRPAGSPSA
jgi:hypothetical protein